MMKHVSSLFREIFLVDSRAVVDSNDTKPLPQVMPHGAHHC